MNLKSKICIALLIFLSVLIVNLSIVYADETYTYLDTEQGIEWSYELHENGNVINLKCITTSVPEEIIIPSVIDGRNVISIGNEGFKNLTGITTIAIPDNVTKIGGNAFEKCESLVSVNLNKVELIEESAFKDCTALTTVTIPKTLKENPTHTIGIGNGVFTGCTSLETVVFESGITMIPELLLAGCTNIEQVTIPDTVTTIEARAFSGSGLVEVDIPDNVTKIGAYAFEKCENLTSVNLNKVEEIEYSAFKDCTALTTVTIPKTLNKGSTHTLGREYGVFVGCTNLETVVFENGIKIIPELLLAGCINIEQVTIPDTVTTIEARAFAGSGLVEVEIPNTVTKIGAYAFEECLNLKEITILDNCIELGYYVSQPANETVFTNHNDDLTIYCYEDSFIAEYAIKNNIKCVYLERPTQEETPGGVPETDGAPGDVPEIDGKPDGTESPEILPNTGKSTVLFIISIILIAGIISYRKTKKYKKI